ncbi:MAG: histidine phosphatase family protein [Lachnospiraceae bacterium]|nr:histidine phosphatase family protein [Lachnospiraceae bacterium]
MKIYIIRHGQTQYNLLGRLQGRLDIPLNENGLALAHVAGQGLRDVHFDAVISSPLTRALQTAHIVLEENAATDPSIEIEIEPAIQEIDFGVWEGLTCKGENCEVPKAEFGLFMTDSFNYIPPEGGETVQAICERTGAFLKRLMVREDLRDANVLLSTHGCATRGLLNSVYKDSTDFWHGKVPPNCSVNVVEVYEGRAFLVASDVIPGQPVEDIYARTRMLIGTDGLLRLRDARVAVFGLGGVGGYAVEALARAGVGTLHLVDHDTVSATNLNRQILATTDWIGKPKTEAASARVKQISPDVCVYSYEKFFLPETEGDFPFDQFDYIVDAIDTVSGKLRLAEIAQEYGISIISAMGAGNKLSAQGFKVADISQTRTCPLARVMRRELKKRGIEHLKVVYSEETALTPQTTKTEEESSAQTDESVKKPRTKVAPGSISYVPGTVGLLMAGEVIRDLIGEI